MNIEYFREFTVLADCSNYLEAADRLFIGQSTLSKHIISMEKELGVPLFERTSRKVALSKYGKLLLPYANTIVQTQYSYHAALQNELESERGRVTVGTIAATAKYGITGLIADFKRRYPNSSIQMFEGDPNDLASQLRERKCDVIFAHMPERELMAETIQRIHYLDDSLVCILPKSHPLAGQKELRLEQLRDETFIALAENTTVHQLILDSCYRVGFSPKIAFTCHRVDSVLDLVTKGMGIAILAEYMANRPEDGNFPENAPFAVAPILPRTSISVDLCYRNNDDLSPMARRFVELVQETVDAGIPAEFNPASFFADKPV
ncbi:MAG: LysR family transcriptional regulator [Lachnospiraceae bacterium]|nr:LysR family transcriptional regulator [Lachnospiraceae bacterium]